jgi:hypothetical protein
VFEALRAGLSEDDINRLRSKAEHLARVADAPTETWETLVRMLLDAEADGVTWTVRSTELALEELAGRSLTPMPPQDESDGPTVGPPESGPTLKGQPPKSTSKPPTPEKNEGDKTGSNKVVEVSLAIGGEPQRLPVDGKVVRARVTGIQITREVLKSLYLGSESEGITEEDGIISISVDELSAHRSPTITSGTVKIEVL